jgi:hypothetical protein
MKILLLGEYSGLHNNLAIGLRNLGHSVTLANNGDNFKNFNRDFDLKVHCKNRMISQLLRIVKEQLFLSRIGKDEYDVIQIMNPDVFSRFHISNPYKKLLKKAKKTFLLAAGDDYFYWKAYRENKYRYSTHKLTLEQDLNQKKSLFEKKRFKKLNIFLANYVDGIISTSINYKIAYQENKNFRANIPFPIKSIKSVVEKKEIQLPIKFLFGIQKGREGFKGVNYILKAINEIKKKYPNEVQFTIVENVPFSEYKKLLEETDCLIDQCNCYEPGMNALIAMSMGKLVFGGCEVEFVSEMNLKNDPLINIIPDSCQISREIERVVLNPELILNYSKKAVAYVSKYHNLNLISEKYISLWSDSSLSNSTSN